MSDLLTASNSLTGLGLECAWTGGIRDSSSVECDSPLGQPTNLVNMNNGDLEVTFDGFALDRHADWNEVSQKPKRFVRLLSEPGIQHADWLQHQEDKKETQSKERSRNK
ncbi:hypothetical protein TESG_08339 [Trichophyton tonsurans CBS 112818]|uniref:Uncharacterized protein n=1 Tax=Trichophyton tonsurans (strain CBS 112818) TaxID=647933 RepID=F2RTJ9_TRIT1|nr:hypothetical protein TESG_08339 [Trichophyton tonsurans CBS 112818]